MKYSAQNLAKALLKLVEENPDKSKEITSSFLKFCKEKHLEYLIPNLLKYINLEGGKMEDSQTLKISGPVEPEESEIKKIKKMVGSDTKDVVEFKKDAEMVAGFIAYYKNKIIDASLSNNMNLLKNKLTNI